MSDIQDVAGRPLSSPLPFCRPVIFGLRRASFVAHRPSGLFNNCRIIRVKKNVQLRLVQIFLIGSARGLPDTVGVVQHDTEVPDTADTGL